MCTVLILFDLNFTKMIKKIVGVIVTLSLNEGQDQGQDHPKFPVQVHLVHINIKYTTILCKEIFKVQCVLVAEAVQLICL